MNCMTGTAGKESYERLCQDAIGVVRTAAAYVSERHENRRGLNVEKK